MANFNYPKKLGAALFAFYGVLSLVGIYQILSNNLGLYNPIVSPLVWIIQDVICCASMCFIIFNKAIQPNTLGRIGAGILALLYGIFTINIALSFAEINILAFLGQYYGIILGLIELIAAALLFYSIKSWMPVRISAFLYWIPSLCSTFYISKLRAASELADKTSDWTLFEKIWSASQTCENIALTLSVITVILTAVWMFKKPMAQHAKSNPIDII